MFGRFASVKQLGYLRQMVIVKLDWESKLGTDEQYLTSRLIEQINHKRDLDLGLYNLWDTMRADAFKRLANSDAARYEKAMKVYQDQFDQRYNRDAYELRKLRAEVTEMHNIVDELTAA